MADISMCEGEHCPRKEQCHRHTAIPNEYWQAYFKPIEHGEKCKYFIPRTVNREENPDVY